MSVERDNYRDVYRAARNVLSIYSDRLTQHEQDAILREAVRVATKREQFWFATALICGPALYLIFDSLASINQISSMAIALATISPALLNGMLKRNSRIKHIKNEVLHILRRKGFIVSD